MRADYLSQAEEVLAEKQSQHCTTRLKEGDGRQQTVFDTEHRESGSPFKAEFVGSSGTLVRKKADF
jgi:hypothetical protein